VRVTGSAPPGKWRHAIELTTDDPRTPVIPVWVEAEVKIKVRVGPEAVFFGFLKPGQTSERKVELSAPQAFRILEVTGLGAHVKADYDAAAAKTHVLRLQFLGRSEPGKFTQPLGVRTDLGDGMTTEVITYAHVEK
jgi:hypothetical protein